MQTRVVVRPQKPIARPTTLQANTCRVQVGVSAPPFTRRDLESALPKFSCIVSRGRHAPLTSAAAEPSASSAEVDDKPLWLKDLEADAPFDEDVAKLLEGANGDPEVVRARMDEEMLKKRSAILEDNTGEQVQMKVVFREVDPFNCWIWLEMHSWPDEGETEAVETVLQSWFMIGRLGGFNGMNLQVFNGTSEDTSYMEYDTEELENSLNAFFHDMSTIEAQGNWLRLWVNMGTADELAFDVLINMLSNFSREKIGIKQLVIGGENEDWKIPEMQLPRATMNPMQNPSSWDLDGMDDLDY